MGQTRDETTRNLAERLCWEVARRDDSRVARRLYRKQIVDGVYRLDEGALLDDFFHFLRAIGVMALLEQACGTAIQRIRYAENETNYCPRCQTGGKLLADRSLSRLLKDDWPKTIEELEAGASGSLSSGAPPRARRERRAGGRSRGGRPR